MRLPCILPCSLVLTIAATSLLPAGERTVREALKILTTIEIPASPLPVERTVARELRAGFAQRAVVNEVPRDQRQRPGSLRVSVLAAGTERSPGWLRLRVAGDGTAELTASHRHLLYTAFCRLRDYWAGSPGAEFAQGKTVSMRLPWLEGNDGLFTGLPRLARGYDPEATIRELARIGCSHVSVNVLASPAGFEQGPPGEIYHRFYSGSPDLDQFVSSELTRGLYPPEYLQANLDLLKRNAALALAYGLTPGLNVCSPRTMPEAFFEKYPYLRGARVDHPFRSYRPRYTATLSHPVVRWHYAQLMRAMMKEVPQLGYLYLWTNDSGSGFEYVSTLYAGRNGGAYLVREWKSNEDISRAAGENVLRYLRLLRDAASEINPAFRVVSALSWFGAEQETILRGLGERLDLHLSAADTTDGFRWATIRTLPGRGAALFSSTRVAGNFILGVPFPWLSQERLTAAVAPGVQEVAVTFDSPSLVPWSINREVLHAFQAGDGQPVDSVVESAARRWVGSEAALSLVQAWRLADRAVRAFPDVPLYGTSWAFPLYRHWVRPFVPNISAVPESDRAYYEQHMIATFNNPTLVDFAADALWLLIPTEQAASIVRTSDSLVWQPLDRAIEVLDAFLGKTADTSAAHAIIRDQRDRLRAARCYYRTLRNVAAWISGVHGSASSPAVQAGMRTQVRGVIDDEIRNAEELLLLWNTSPVHFMPVMETGENWSMYGRHFGELVQRKIALMRKYRNDAPWIDPDFMWRVGSECPVPPAEYLKY